MSESTDHDVIVVLVERVNNLIQSQWEFHKLVNTNFDELKNNYSAKIVAHEIRLNKLENRSNKINTLLTVGIGILSILVGIMVYHVFEK